MTIDFRADQIRMNKLIASGNSGLGPGLVIYSVSASSNLQGGIDSTKFNTSGIGIDVFMFVSGASGSIGTSIRGVTAFGGDVVVSGTLKIGSSSVQILGNQNKIAFSALTTIFHSSSQLYFTDSLNLSPVALATLTNLPQTHNSRLVIGSYKTSTQFIPDSCGAGYFKPQEHHTGSGQLRAIVATTTASNSVFVKLWNVISQSYVHIGGPGIVEISSSQTQPTLLTSSNLLVATNFSTVTASIYELQIYGMGTVPISILYSGELVFVG